MDTASKYLRYRKFSSLGRRDMRFIWGFCFEIWHEDPGSTPEFVLLARGYGTWIGKLLKQAVRRINKRMTIRCFFETRE